MGRITVKLDDELERKVRMKIAKQGGKKGDLAKAVDDALYSWSEQSEFERHLNGLKRHRRPRLWIKISELRKFDQLIHSLRTNISIIDIEDAYRPNINIDLKEIKESVDEIRRSLSELEEILPEEDCKGKYFEDFKNSIDKIIEKALKEIAQNKIK